MSGKRDLKGKFHPLVWFGEGKYLGLLSFGLWFEGPLIFPDFGLLCHKQNGATIQLDFFFFFGLFNIDWLQMIHQSQTCLSLTIYTTFKNEMSFLKIIFISKHIA